MSQKLLNKILVVEDENDIRTILKFTLERLGHFTVLYCSSGIEALESAEIFSPDLILLDVMMPGMDGIETLKELRNKLPLRYTPVIFMTAKTQADEIANYKKLGAIDVITKPFDPTLLVERLWAIWKEKINEQ